MLVTCVFSYSQHVSIFPKLNLNFKFTFILLSANTFNFDQTKILSFGKEFKNELLEKKKLPFSLKCGKKLFVWDKNFYFKNYRSATAQTELFKLLNHFFYTYVYLITRYHLYHDNQLIKSHGSLPGSFNPFPHNDTF